MNEYDIITHPHLGSAKLAASVNPMQKETLQTVQGRTAIELPGTANKLQRTDVNLLANMWIPLFAVNIFIDQVKRSFGEAEQCVNIKDLNQIFD